MSVSSSELRCPSKNPHSLTLSPQQFSPLPPFIPEKKKRSQLACPRKEMEAKKLRVAAMAALCVLLLLVERQQVAAMSEFCHCYRDCYSECRHDAPRWLCLPSCVDYCSSSPGTSQPAIGDDGGATCRMACKLSLGVCGWAADPDDAADAAICVQNCNRKWSHKAN